ncbi:dihydroorotate dehydrogenase [Xylella fastidiosa]|uniref:Periplasmic divalent cation tolerance protein n=2 Tax=Xylella fastidiosa (strain 9a5c) TaxID=160492 RepID=Q9PFN8_XYLFA|nr:divalent-cation tolerance protein CutA [Xylella fastidiosa]AAF83429.1 periplasmic divalent cation tolerance protein [Xylella fastidiosa 9a5c]ALQ94225.1 dihydroorotate dehydrogenase [Xylella fastidiosa]
MASDVYLIFSTCPDLPSAEIISRVLVQERLAACVTQLPGAVSTYRWQGKIETTQEIQLLIKTNAVHVNAAITRLCALHPYRLPEAIAVQVSVGLPEYLTWINTEIDEEYSLP